MKKGVTWILAVLLLGGIVKVPAAWGLSLMDAVEQSARKIVEELPPKSRVAIIAFESPNNNLSDYIMDELTGALVERGVEVADRRNLDYVYKELKFHASGEVNEKTAQSIGKFLGAQLVITGQLALQGKNYRYRASAIHVEKATLAAVIRLDVDNDRAMKNLVTAMEKQKTTVKTASYGVDEKTVPKTTGTFLDRGILFATRGNYELAIMDFSDAIKLEPNLAAAYMLRGRALYASVSKVYKQEENFSGVDVISTDGKASADQIRVFDQAIADFTQALRLDPDNANAYNERGSAYAAKGDYDQALADYNQAIRLDPNDTHAYNNRGLAYAKKKDYDRAIADYNQAIRLNSNNAAAYNNRGSSYFEKKDYDRAIADYNQWIKLDPNNANAYFFRGQAYSSKKDYNRAIADYNQGIKLDPNNADAYGSRGSAYFEKKDYDKAIADFTQAIKLDPNNAGAYIWRGGAHWWKNDLNHAIADFETALRIEPNNAWARENLANARRARGW
jgi:tetratricopeptide (TPR) repeat protein